MRRPTLSEWSGLLILSPLLAVLAAMIVPFFLVLSVRDAYNWLDAFTPADVINALRHYGLGRHSSIPRPLPRDPFAMQMAVKYRLGDAEEPHPLFPDCRWCGTYGASWYTCGKHASEERQRMRAV